MKKRESYKKHLNRGVMAVSFAVIFIVFSIMGGRIQAFADDAVATQTDAAKSNSSGPVTTGLAIDGYYGEWSQYPSADITYNSNNGYSVHKGQIAIDGDRLYVHFSMNDLYTSQMQFQFWNITVDGKQCVLNVLPVNSDGSINWSGQMYNLGEGIYRNFGVFAGYYTDIDGDVAFTVYDAAHTETGKGDEIEFSISMKKLADYLGIAGKTCAVSGAGNVAIYAIQKAHQLGAKCVTCSDSTGWIYDPEGIDVALLKEVKEVKRARLDAYAAARPSAEYHVKKDANDHGVWSIKCDLALPCATQNELNLDDAKMLVANGVISVTEGANMPTTLEATKYLQENGVLFVGGKAANAGGVATSALEMSQNSERLSWTFEEVDGKLKGIMETIYANISDAAKRYNMTVGGNTDYVAGANIAGFEKVVDAMLAQGVC